MVLTTSEKVSILLPSRGIVFIWLRREVHYNAVSGHYTGRDLS